jgi:hypothetical protein
MKLDPVTQYLLEARTMPVNDIKERIEHFKSVVDRIEYKLDKAKARLQYLKGKEEDEPGTMTSISIHSKKKDIEALEQDLAKYKGLLKKEESLLDDTGHMTPEGHIGTAIAVASVLTAAVVLGNKIYKQYFSKAAQACKQAKDKDLCMKQFKNKAVEVEISQLQKAKAYCKKSTNPKQCISKLDQEIQKNKAKLSK